LRRNLSASKRSLLPYALALAHVPPDRVALLTPRALQT
jgi:hypothetical protein